MKNSCHKQDFLVCWTVFICTQSALAPDKLLYLIQINMETTAGYKTKYEQKNQRLDIRLDESMIQRLKQIRRETGISVSELCREAVRRLIMESQEGGSFNIKV